MRLPFLEKEKHLAPILIFDIASDSVAASVVQMGRDIPHVLYTKRMYMRVPETIDFTRYEEMMRVTLLDVALELQKNISPIGKFSTIHIFFASPWNVSDVSIVTRHSQKSFLATRKDIEEMITAQTNAYQDSIESDKREQIQGAGVVIEKAAMSIRLNGYPVRAVDTARVRNLKVAIHTAVLGRSIVKHVREVMEKVFHTDDVTLHTNTLAMHSVLRSIFPNVAYLLFVEVSGEVTDVILSAEGVPVEHISFPVGIHTLARNKKQETGTPISETIKSFGDTIPTNGSLLHSWGESFSKIISGIGDEWMIPHRVQLITPAGHFLSFKSAIQSATYTDIAFPPDAFSIQNCGRPFLSDRLKYETNTDPDTPLGYQSLFLEMYPNVNMIL